MWLYNFLDILCTITECFGFYVVMRCLCRNPRFPWAVSGIMPPAIYGIYVVIFTFFVDLGIIKVFLVFPAVAVLIKIFYKAALHEGLIVMELFYILLVTIPEDVGLSLVNLACHGDVLTVADGVTILKWQCFVATLLLRLILTVAVHRLLRSFRYSFQVKDAVVLTVSFLVAFFPSIVSIYEYLELQIGDTLIMDLVSAVLCASFVVQFLYSKNVSCLREQEQMNRMQLAQLQQKFAYYQEKLKDEERVRSVYHDMKNHLLVLEAQAGSPETAGMAEKLRREVAAYEDYVHTGSDILDIILKEKAELSREKGIELSVAADLSGMGFLEPLDISTIFGNGLDNAIEASEKLPEGQRVILVKAGRVQNFFSVLIENNCVKGIRIVWNGTEKEDDFLHGFGISNMRKAVGKYDGQLTARCERGRFTLKILVPIP